MNTRAETTRRQKGQSLVEFAISFTVIALLLAGIVDLGRGLFYWLALRDAAQEAAVFASICPDDLAKIQNRAVTSSHAPVDFTSPAHSGNISIDCAFVSDGASCGSETPTVGNGIRITITYSNFPITMPMLGAVVGSQTLTLRATVEDTILRATCCPHCH